MEMQSLDLRNQPVHRGDPRYSLGLALKLKINVLLHLIAKELTRRKTWKDPNVREKIEERHEENK